jgi:hypothetical protein
MPSEKESITSNKPDMAKQFYIDRAIEKAAFILERIDHRWSSSSADRD